MSTIVSTGKITPPKTVKYKAATIKTTKPKLQSGKENTGYDGRSLLTSNQDNEAIGNLYGNRCVHCGSSIFCIHEIEPRSTGKKSMLLSNRVPLCPEFHDFLHTQSSPKKLRHQLQIWQARNLKLIYKTSNWNKLAAIFLSLQGQHD